MQVQRSLNLLLQNSPKVEYFCTAVNIRLKLIIYTTTNTTCRYTSGDTISFGDLEVSFLVDENLENYREITWLVIWYRLSQIKNTI